MEREFESRSRASRDVARGTARNRTEDEHLVPNLEGLFTGALQRLAEATGATSGVAWAHDADGAIFRAAELGEPGERLPSEPEMRALLALPGATNLGARGTDPPLRTIARELGLSAAVPITALAPNGGPARPIGAMSIGLPPSRAVRPRTLAALDHAAQRLCAPVTTALAVTRLFELDREVLGLTRLATLGELLAEVVHEVRNPLVSVKTFLQLLPGHLDDPDFHTNFRLVVLDEARRMERLLNSLLHQARPSAEQPDARAALGATIESIGRLLEKRAHAKDIALTIDVGADLPEAMIGEDELRQIVLNLALNAFDATPPGGRVRLAAIATQDPVEQAVEFIVDDAGPGVPEEDRPKLFDPFFSTRSQRPIGLGLTVSSRLARDANGAIHVEDSPEGGARFRVWLPAS